MQLGRFTPGAELRLFEPGRLPSLHSQLDWGGLRLRRLNSAYVEGLQLCAASSRGEQPALCLATSGHFASRGPGGVSDLPLRAGLYALWRHGTCNDGGLHVPE